MPYEDRAPWPSDIRRQPWEHQHEAYNVLGTLWFEGQPGVALFSGMGTGKSLVALALISAFKFRRTLILCPKAMTEEWPEMVLNETQGLHPVPLDGTTKQRAEIVRGTFDIDHALVYVCNIESFWRNPLYTELVKRTWDCIIIDESQKIKSPSSKQSMAAMKLGRRAQYRLIMTGTPLHDKPLDVYGQYRFLDTRIFGNRVGPFRERYAEWRTIANNVRIPTGFINLDELSKKIYSVGFRVTEDVLDLPELVTVPRRFELDRATRKTYQTMKQNAMLDFGTDGWVISPNALSKIARLQQITSGFVPVTSELDIETITELGTERRDAFVELLDELDPDLPVVVFARYTRDLDAIRTIAAKTGRDYYEQSGQRHEWRDWRSYTGNQILGVQIQAGGAGIDLTRSPYAIFYSRSFSLGDYEQAVRRVYRPGQTRTTFIYHILAADTVDTMIYEAIVAKRSVAEYVLEQLRAETVTAGTGSPAQLTGPAATV